VLDKWKQINPSLTITALKTGLTGRQNRRDVIYSEIWGQIKRLRSSIRKSERKRPIRKTAAAKTK
jgi:hypothetical protein